MRYRFHFISFALMVALASGCKPIDVFEYNQTIPQYAWKSNQPVTGTFRIADTAALYNIYIVLRHTEAYAYNNIWIDMGLQAPGDSMFSQKIDLGLGNDAQGWEGTGLNDIWEVRKLINGRPMQFRKAGEYHFRLKQIMRDNPLRYVMSAGLHIEKK